MTRQSGKKPRSNRAIVAVAIILTVILVLMLTVFLYITYLLGLINFPALEGSFIGRDELLAYIEAQKEDYDPNFVGGVLDPDDILLEIDGELFRDENVINILLVGSDARPGETRARADAMILCTFHKEKKELTLTSFMRDLYVQIPGYPDHRLNSAYAWGGMELLEQTLALNFGIVVDGTFCVDFSSFEQVIDQVGGVDIQLSAAEARYLNGDKYSEGINHLDGKDALTYARIRSIGNSDFDRTGRQQKVLDAIVQSCRGMKLRQLNSLAQTVLPLLSTNMTKGQIMSLLATVLPHAGDVQMQEKLRIPADNTFEFAYVSEMSVLVPDLAQNRDILYESLYE